MIQTPQPATAPVRYRRVRHLAWRKVVAETVVMDLRRRTIFGINDPAVWVLECLGTPRRLDELLGAMGLSNSKVEGVAVEEFVTRLLADRLIEVDTSDHPASDVLAPVRFSCAPTVAWHEQLEEVTHLVSIPNEIGNNQCTQ